MTPLRERMIRELELHRKSPLTVDAYVKAVAQLAQYYGRSPDAITVEEVRDFLHYLSLLNNPVEIGLYENRA